MCLLIICRSDGDHFQKISRGHFLKWPQSVKLQVERRDKIKCTSQCLIIKCTLLSKRFLWNSVSAVFSSNRSFFGSLWDSEGEICLNVYFSLLNFLVKCYRKNVYYINVMYTFVDIPTSNLARQNAKKIISVGQFVKHVICHN